LTMRPNLILPSDGTSKPGSEHHGDTHLAFADAT
jgi:hypothetical protein